ncbi:MAG: ABC transporter permease [Bythopirellula sp.]
MWAYVIRRLIYNIPVFLAIVLLVMWILRYRDPVPGLVGKQATVEEIETKREELGLNRPFLVQYGTLIKEMITFDFSQEMWTQPGMTVGEQLRKAVPISLLLTLPALFLTTVISVSIGMLSAYARGRWLDKMLVFFAVLGMSVSFLVYIIFGQYFGSYQLGQLVGRPVFSIHGYEAGLQNWAYYMLLPVMISVIVSMGYNTRFYRAVMVEETTQDYITTAWSKGATTGKIMFVHMLRNAMIPIITRIMITLPLLVTGSILLERYFGIPGMGDTLLSAINNNDFPVIEVFSSIFAGLFICTIILTDVLYAIFDPRVRLH